MTFALSKVLLHINKCSANFKYFYHSKFLSNSGTIFFVFLLHKWYSKFMICNRRYGLWVITGMGFEHRNFLSTKLVDSKWYGLSQVMGYHSMGYLRFDCK